MTCYKSEPPSSPLSSHFFPLLFSFSPSSFCGLLMSPQHVAPEHSPEPLIRRTIWSILTDIYNHPSVVNHVIPGQFVIEFVTSHAQGPPYSRRRCLSDLLNYNYEEINDPGTSKLHPPCGICRESYLGMENSTHPNTTRVPLPTHRCAAHSSPATQRWMGVQQRCSGV
jgi:hypothetical protein